MDRQLRLDHGQLKPMDNRTVETLVDKSAEPVVKPIEKSEKSYV